MTQEQIVEERRVYPIEKIVTHTNPHIDEITGIWLLRRFGEALFPGIKSAQLEFCSEGSNKLKSEEEFLAENTLLVGIGGGMFDEHPTPSTERKSGKCAATLIADYLGISDDPALELILDFVQRNDLNGNGSMFDIGSVCREMYQLMPETKVMVWATVALEAIFAKQVNFATEAAEELKRARSYYAQRDRDLKIIAIESDNEVVAKLARSKRGHSAAVVVQKRSSGNVQIFSNRFYKVDIAKIARFIRQNEQKAKKVRVNINPQEMAREGTVVGAEEWYFFAKGGMLFNGSTSHPDIAQTKLQLEEIVRIVCACA